jgi:hypothetical protein
MAEALGHQGTPPWCRVVNGRKSARRPRSASAVCEQRDFVEDVPSAPRAVNRRGGAALEGRGRHDGVKFRQELRMVLAEVPLHATVRDQLGEISGKLPAREEERMPPRGHGTGAMMSKPWVLGISASQHHGAACLMRGDDVVVAISSRSGLEPGLQDCLIGAEHPSTLPT